MKTKLNTLKKILVVLIPLVLVAVVVLRLKKNKDISQQKVYHYDKEKPILVQTDTLDLTFLNESNSFTGSFEPHKESKISADVQGKINSVLVDVGSLVNKGQALVQLDNSLLKLQLQTIEVQIEGLQDDVNRYTILSKVDAVQGVQLEKAQLGLKLSKIQRATLLEQISKSTIKAPFNGIITLKLNEEGGFAALGVPLLQITDITSLKFTVNVAETDLSSFTQDQNYPISVDAYPDISLSGKTIMVGSKSNVGNSFPVQFKVANTKNLTIKSGMFGKVLLKESGGTKGIVIPSSAITEEGGNTQVYLLKNNKAVLQKINVSKNITNKSVVSSGLKVGDILITGGFINLFEGAPVIVN